MRVVVDASVAIAWIFKDDPQTHREYADALRLGIDSDALSMSVPQIFHTEIAYRLLKTGRAKRLKAITIAEQAELVTARVDETSHFRGDAAAIARAALMHHVQGFDVHYLMLAIEKNASIATLDKGLIAACRREGIPVWKP